MYCPNCGKQIDDDAAFCIYCGAKVAENSYASTGAGGTRTKHQNTHRKMIIIIIIAAAAACIAFFLARNFAASPAKHAAKWLEQGNDDLVQKDNAGMSELQDGDDRTETADEDYDTSQNVLDIHQISDFSDGYAWVNYVKDGEERRGICDHYGRITVSFAHDILGYETPVMNGSAFVKMMGDDENQYIIDTDGTILADLSGYENIVGAKNGYYMFYNEGLIDNYDFEYVFFDSHGEFVPIGEVGQQLLKEDLPKDLASVSPGRIFTQGKIWDEALGTFIWQDPYSDYQYPGAQQLLDNEYHSAYAIGDSFETLGHNWGENEFFCYEKKDSEGNVLSVDKLGYIDYAKGEVKECKKYLDRINLSKFEYDLSIQDERIVLPIDGEDGTPYIVIFDTEWNEICNPIKVSNEQPVMDQNGNEILNTFQSTNCFYSCDRLVVRGENDMVQVYDKDGNKLFDIEKIIVPADEQVTSHFKDRGIYSNQTFCWSGQYQDDMLSIYNFVGDINGNMAFSKVSDDNAVEFSESNFADKSVLKAVDIANAKTIASAIQLELTDKSVGRVENEWSEVTADTDALLSVPEIKSASSEYKFYYFADSTSVKVCLAPGIEYIPKDCALTDYCSGNLCNADIANEYKEKGNLLSIGSE